MNSPYSKWEEKPHSFLEQVAKNIKVFSQKTGYIYLAPFMTLNCVQDHFTSGAKNQTFQG